MRRHRASSLAGKSSEPSGNGTGNIRQRMVSGASGKGARALDPQPSTLDPEPQTLVAPMPHEAEL